MDVEAVSAKPRLRLLLDHFANIKDTRQGWKVAYPLREVLFLVVCGTIASGDDYEDIVDWGKAHLPFLRGFSEFHFGIPCADWLRAVMNRINPDLFQACFTSWVAQCWPDKLELVAIDGKTSRGSHNRKVRRPASGVGVRNKQPTGAGPGGGRGKIKRDYCHSRLNRAPRPLRRSGLD